jgi:hypothetical protein
MIGREIMEKVKTTDYDWMGKGSLSYKGKDYPWGETLSLTDDEVKELDHLINPLVPRVDPLLRKSKSGRRIK